MQDRVAETKASTVKLYESSLLSNALGDILRPGSLRLTARAMQIAKIDKDSVVLDIACGKGATAFFLAQQYGCHVIGIDLSRKMIPLARSKAELEKLSVKVDFLVSDAEGLPFADSVFDVVISECSFSLLPNKQIAASGINRVLKPGGKLVITDVILNGEICEELQTRAAIASCIAGAKPLAGYLEIFERAGFKEPYVEDHSEELKKVAYQILLGCGSLENFSTQITKDIASHQKENSKVWQRLFKQAKPGYVLIAVTKL